MTRHPDVTDELVKVAEETAASLRDAVVRLEAAIARNQQAAADIEETVKGGGNDAGTDDG